MNSNFPDDFLWGVVTSSYQIEGAVAEDGRGESIWDRFAHTPDKIQDGSTGDVACDHYHHYQEDVQLIRSLGVNVYRFSVAWPRVLPKGFGRINPAGLDFYDALVDELLKANIRPALTLYHWDLPQYLQDYGGWGNRDTAKAFVEYADVVSRKLGDRVQLWMTHNEMWCTVFQGHYFARHAPGLSDFKLALQAAHHVLLSHGLAVPVIRENIQNDAQVGITPNITLSYPATDSQADEEAARRFDGFFNRWFLDPLAGRGYPEDMWEYYGENTPQVESNELEQIAVPLDFLGVNYYNPVQIADDPNGDPPHTRSVPNPALERTADREIYPEGLYKSLVRLHQEYDFPMFIITENGAAYPDVSSEDGGIHDTERIKFLEAHFEQAARTIEAGVPLKGFFVWTLMDNFEWMKGYTLRYGLIYVDFQTQQRIIKDSGHWYRRFIEEQY